MVKFRFFDNDGNRISNFDASDELPDEVASMDIMGPLDVNKSNFELLTTMLKKSSKKLRRISIENLSAESPEFLAFLVLICNMTSSLRLWQCPLSSHAMTCLMAGLLTRDGIRRFSFTFEDSPLTTNQAKILLEGIASSPCLEIFDLVAQFMNSEDVSRHLIQALRRNQSLKEISLDTSSFADDDFQNIASASISSPNLKAVSIVDHDRQLQLDELQGALCRKDCTLEKLHLQGVEISTGQDGSLDSWDESIMQNVSVTSLRVYKSESNDSAKLAKMISLFKSLEELDVSINQFTQLSFLDPLLFSGERSKLNSLDVSYNDIEEEELRNFIGKLQNIRGLKHLAINCDELERSDSIKTALIEALRHNIDLEHVDFDRTDLPLDLNRAGRRVLESSQNFPTNLLARVLERASRISYYKHYDKWGSPTKEARADVVFWMIQRIIPQL